MTRPRRRMFGPLFYVTAALAVVACVGTRVYVTWDQFVEAQQRQRMTAELRSRNPALRAAALNFLSRRGEGGFEPDLIAAAGDSDPGVRAAACGALGAVGGDFEVVIATLVVAARDSDGQVRSAAARSLGGVLHQVRLRAHSTAVTGPALAALKAGIGDADAEVRAAAADSLVAFGPGAKSASTRLAAAAARDADRPVRLAAARALVEINGPDDPDARRVLVQLAADPTLIADRAEVVAALKWAGPDTLAEVAEALARLAAAHRSAPPQAGFDDGEERVGADALRCLALIGPPARAALPALDALIRDEAVDPDVRSAAALTVAEIAGRSSPEGVAALLGLVVGKDGNGENREQAIMILFGVDPKLPARAAPDLIRQLSDPDPAVRGSAYRLLGTALESQAAIAAAAPTVTPESPAGQAP